jgi:hypothetical protein
VSGDYCQEFGHLPGFSFWRQYNKVALTNDSINAKKLLNKRKNNIKKYCDNMLVRLEASTSLLTIILNKNKYPAANLKYA